VSAGTEYYYRVHAFDAAGNLSASSNEASATLISVEDDQPPSAPTNLQASGRPDGILLSWNASSDNVGVDSYDVLRSPSQGSGYSIIGSSATTSYNDTATDRGLTYYYRVQGLDAAGNRSATSNEAAGRRDAFVVLDSDPADGMTGGSTGTTPQVFFSEAVQSRTVSGTTIRLMQVAKNEVVEQAPGSPRLEANGSTVTVIPRYPLYTNTTYRLEVLAGAKAPRSQASNVSLNTPFRSTFTTSSTPSSTAAPFEAAATDPQDGETGVSTDSSLTVSFLASMDRKSLNAKTVRLYAPTGNKVKLAVSPQVSADGMTFTWAPLFPLAPSSTYRLELKSGKKGIRGHTGQPLPDTLTVTFTTSDTAATQGIVLGVSE
jgi:hypothetical protein